MNPSRKEKRLKSNSDDNENSDLALSASESVFNKNSLLVSSYLKDSEKLEAIYSARNSKSQRSTLDLDRVDYVGNDEFKVWKSESIVKVFHFL